MAPWPEQGREPKAPDKSDKRELAAILPKELEDARDIVRGEQLFDKDNYVNKHFDKFIFSTEGHIFSVDSRFREKVWMTDDVPSVPLSHFNISEPTCEYVESTKKYSMPLKSRYLLQVGEALGIEDY